MLLFAGILGLYFVPEGEISPKDSWIIYLPLLLWCIMLSRFQMESIIRKIPFLGALHKLMVSDSKPWAEAMYLNITLIILFVFLAGGFSIFS
jgi:multisubunit Na+/H+ antiporter MnhE subunit